MLQRTISKRNQNDEEDLSQHAEECLAPDAKDLRTDVARVVHHCQAAQPPVFSDGETGNARMCTGTLPSRTNELVFVTLRDGLRHGRRNPGKCLREFRGDGYQCALPVVDGNAQHVLPVSEALHKRCSSLFGTLSGTCSGVFRATLSEPALSEPVFHARSTLPTRLSPNSSARRSKSLRRARFWPSTS